MGNTSNQDLQTPGSKEPLRRVVDSTVAIAFARFFMPIALSVIGYLMITMVSDLKSGTVDLRSEMRASNGAVWTAVRDVAAKVSTQSTDIAVLKTNNDATGKSIERLTVVIDKLSSKP